ncbi:hypothetical protein [Streptomyces sp. NPDC001970]
MINLLTTRHHDRHALSRMSPDHLGAKVLAHLLRSDCAEHLSLSADSEPAQAVTVRACTRQDAV